jgi:hypothetical protein
VLKVQEEVQVAEVLKELKVVVEDKEDKVLKELQDHKVHQDPHQIKDLKIISQNLKII